jgi:hypothetical protein
MTKDTRLCHYQDPEWEDEETGARCTWCRFERTDCEYDGSSPDEVRKCANFKQPERFIPPRVSPEEVEGILSGRGCATFSTPGATR